MLQPLGISAEAEALYVALAPLGSATREELATLTSMTPADIDARLEELRRLGLATELAGGSWRHLPLPEVAKALRAQRISELEMASVAAESLHSHLLAARQSQSDDIQIVLGREAIIAMTRDLCASAQKEICMFDKPPYVEDRDATPQALSEEAPEWQALERGTRLRCIYHPGFDTDRLKELSLFTSKGEESRTAPVPMKLILVDGELAIIPSMRSYLPGHELRMSVVRHSLLVEALQWQFEAIWDTAVPIVASTYSEVDPRRQMLMSLLMTGSTDQAIASNLGINVRSVRRWIAELMDELGVSTRLQLGAAMVRAEHIRNQASGMAQARPSS
jgi:sugar-specific transcriptional regulator TrmB/DNA-binding CsgD family transcriptional regulator